MAGVVCLQGGAEFGDACREMDAELLRRAGGGRVVVVALAASPGLDYDGATARGVDYWTSLGAFDVVGAPDARSDSAGALAALAGARVIVLPGGSPTRLLNALRTTGLAAALGSAVADDAVLTGASAGAMVLCAWTLLPERGTPELVAGLDIVPRTMVLPHFTGDTRWLDEVRGQLPDDVVVLGLAECAGVVAEGPGFATFTAIGAAATRVLGAREALLPVGASLTI